MNTPRASTLITSANSTAIAKSPPLVGGGGGRVRSSRRARAFGALLPLWLPLLAAASALAQTYESPLVWPNCPPVSSYRGQNGGIVYYYVTPMNVSAVWGTGIYTDDSDLRTATLHYWVTRTSPVSSGCKFDLAKALIMAL